MGWLIAIGVLLLLALLPLGVDARYDSCGPAVKFLAGPVRLTVYPRSGKKKNKKKQEYPTQQVADTGAQDSPPAGKHVSDNKPSGGSWKDFLPLVKTALAFLGDFRRKLRVDHLDCNLVLGGTDPAKLAMGYGRAWAAVGNLLTALERCFAIRKRNVEVQCDFTSPETRVTFRVQITVTLGRLLGLIVRYGLRALKEYLTLRKTRKGGINHE